jgi:hypothetical protein
LFFNFSLFILDEGHFLCHSNKKNEKKVELEESMEWRSHFGRFLWKTESLTEILVEGFEKGTFGSCVYVGRKKERLRLFIM